MKRYLKYALNVLDSQNVQCNTISLPINELSFVDYGIHYKYLRNDFYDKLKCLLENDCKNDTLYFISDNFLLTYTVFISDPEKREFIVAGPVRFENQKSYVVNLIENKLELSKVEKEEFLNLFQQLPKFVSSEQFSALLTSLLSPVFNYNLFSKNIVLEDSTDTSVHIHKSLLANVETDYDIIQKRYDAEKAFTNAVSLGDVTKATYYHNKFRQFYIGPRALNELRNTKNMLIVFNTVLRKAVDKADVHPYYINKLSREFSIYIESCTNVKQLDIYDSMLEKYCKLVQDHSLKGHSKTVRSCISYIEFHYNEEISLNMIADELFLNPSYISTLFKKEMNMTITDYIYHVRLKQAAFLLKDSNLAICDIAQACGFSDMNYFSRVFKKYNDMTPTTYRKLNTKS